MIRLLLLAGAACGAFVASLAVGIGALGSVANPPAAGRSAHGLPADYVIPPDANPVEVSVIRYALDQLDKPYVFDAAGPDAFDCSGLTMAAWEQGGIHLAHSTTDQASAGTPTTVAALEPGDLILVAGDDGTVAVPEHVGLYLGSGLVINAADVTDGIRVQSVADFVRVGRGLSAVRHLG